jgi:hypothetical protein
MNLIGLKDQRMMKKVKLEEMIQFWTKLQKIKKKIKIIYYQERNLQIGAIIDNQGSKMIFLAVEKRRTEENLTRISKLAKRLPNLITFKSLRN